MRRLFNSCARDKSNKLTKCDFPELCEHRLLNRVSGTSSKPSFNGFQKYIQHKLT